MPRRTPLLLAAALLAVAVAAVPGSADAASPLTLTPPPGPVEEGSLAKIAAVFDSSGGVPDRFRFGRGDDTVTFLDAPAAPPYERTGEHAYLDEGTYQVRVRVTVPGGADVSRGAQIVVVNAAPILDPLPDASAPLGEPFELLVAFSDSGATDLHDVVVDWGDGSPAGLLADVSGGSAAFSHTYVAGGAFPVVVTVDDGDGGSVTDDFTATVVPFCGGLPVTIDASALGPASPITGTGGPDVILGTPRADVIDARGGDDVVCGGRGDDVIDGGRGNDVLLGEGGDDTLLGNSGNDTLLGGNRNDSLDGGWGDDTLLGGFGHDAIVGGPGHDTVRAGRGDDTVSGDAGNDTLFGEPGDDFLRGGPGADAISGGPGADRLEGGTEDDALSGNGGDDHLLGDEGDDILRGFGEADTLEGGDGDDALSGGRGPDVLRGGGGGDVLYGGSGRDELAGEAGTDFLFRSEYPSLDRMDGGPDSGEEDVIDTSKRGTYNAGIRRYLTEAEALAFQGAYQLSEFTTYHNCCENRVVNIQLMANTIHGHVVLPGEQFSINATVGQRTTAKGYLLAGAIIGAYVQCCDNPANVGGGTSQFGTTFYNAVFFAGLKDIEHQPHSLDFARYPDGREATMGWPRPDVVFRNDTGHPVLITTHHGGYYGTSITVKIWGDNDRRIVTAGASPRRNIHNTSVVIYEGDRSLSPGQQVVKYAPYAGYTIDVYRYMAFRDGRSTTEKWTWTYSAHPKVVKVHPCEVPPGNADYTGEACPAPPGGGGGDPIDPL
ncbi:MAG: VanW family protein [Actinomycetota bacterium]